MEVLCSLSTVIEVEADASRQVFTGLQWNRETGLLSLEASHTCPLRLGLEFAARQRYLTGDQVAKLIGHVTWSCLLRRPALSLINAGYRFARTFKPSDHVTVGCCLWSPGKSGGLVRCCRYSIAALPVHGHFGFTPRMHLEGHVVATASRVVGAISRRLRLQAGVLSDGFSVEDFHQRPTLGAIGK